VSDDNVEPQDPVEAPAEAAEDQPQPPNGVLVVRIEQPDGTITTDTFPQGDVKATEVETILGLGLIGWRSKVGLSAR
jgi:hypothetical protein